MKNDENSEAGGFRVITSVILFGAGMLSTFDSGKPKPKKESYELKHSSIVAINQSRKLVMEARKQLLDEENIIKKLFFVSLHFTLSSDSHMIGILVATNKRIIKLTPGFSSQEVESLNYQKISKVSSNSGLVFDSLKFYASSSAINLDKVIQGNTNNFVNYVNEQI